MTASAAISVEQQLRQERDRFIAFGTWKWIETHLKTGGAPVLGWFGGYYDLKRYRNCDFYAGVTRDIVRHIGEKSGAPERSLTSTPAIANPCFS